MGWLQQKRINLLERSLAVMQRAARRSSRSESQPAHLATGIDGEDAAFFYLGRKGYTVVARRWSSGYQRGDLDLAAAEVAVDTHKRNVLRKLARHYVRQLPTKAAPAVRFDILSVYLVPGKEKEFVHFEGAFGWTERQEYDPWYE
jgi:putative endonuclease